MLGAGMSGLSTAERLLELGVKMSLLSIKKMNQGDLREVLIGAVLNIMI